MGSLLDSKQIIKDAYDDTNHAHQVKAISGALITEKFDNIAITYVPSGNGAGQISTAVYKLGSTTVATLTMTYNSSDKLTGIVKT